MISIRGAEIVDCASVETCARAAYLKYVERIGKEPAPMVADFAAQIEAGEVIVVLNKTTLIAFAVCYPRDGEFHLENIAVTPEYQANGVGRHLRGFIHQDARPRGFEAVSLYTNEKMVENLAWYKKLGYTETGRCVEDGFSRVWFRKSL